MKKEDKKTKKIRCDILTFNNTTYLVDNFNFYDGQLLPPETPIYDEKGYDLGYTLDLITYETYADNSFWEGELFEQKKSQ